MRNVSFSISAHVQENAIDKRSVLRLSTHVAKQGKREKCVYF
jgi:hypothetical protein